MLNRQVSDFAVGMSTPPLDAGKFRGEGAGGGGGPESGASTGSGLMLVKSARQKICKK